jgi:hypothetical protein
MLQSLEDFKNKVSAIVSGECNKTHLQAMTRNKLLNEIKDRASSGEKFYKLKFTAEFKSQDELKSLFIKYSQRHDWLVDQIEKSQDLVVLTYLNNALELTDRELDIVVKYVNKDNL